MPTRFDHGLVVGKFYPPHAGHHHLIGTAAAVCARVTVVVAPSSVESIPLDLRLRWLREVHAETPWVTFVGVIDDHPVDYRDPDVWDAHCALFRTAVDQAAAGRPGTGPAGAGTDRIGRDGAGRDGARRADAGFDCAGFDGADSGAGSVAAVDAVFSSEAYGDELARRFGAVHVPVDVDRSTVPVSGTAVRADPVAYWPHLAPPVRAWFARRVVAVGAESTGTTTLSRALAAALRDRGGVWAGTRWVAEYGRELTERKLAALRRVDPTATIFEVTWSAADFVEVVTAQNAAEEAAARAGSPILVCDTDARATAIWEERYLGGTSPAVRAAARMADLYLLTDHVDVPFTDDGLRDGAHLRAWMTDRFRAELRAAGAPVVELTGPPGARLAAALDACDALLARGWSLADPIPQR